MTGFADLAGKVAVVTGGASGMGRGIAEAFQAAGAQVVIADVEPQALETTSAETGLTGIRTDVRDLVSVTALAEQVVDRFGAVHIVVNNAGVGSMGRIADLSIADWRWMLDVNLYGVIHGVHAFLPYLKRNADGGHIVNTSSVSGLVTGPTTGPYAVSKFGVVALTEVLAAELEQEGSPVGASVLLPGPTRTNIARSSRNRDAGEQSGLVDIAMEDTGLFDTIPWKEPIEIGRIVIDGMARGDLHIFTHAAFIDAIQARHRAIDATAEAALMRFAAEG